MKTETNISETYADSFMAHLRERIAAGYPFGVDDDGEEQSAFDYLADTLDIEYTIDGAGEFRGAVICVSIGGPNVYIDTRREELSVYWEEKATRELPAAFIEPLHDAAAEFYAATR